MAYCPKCSRWFDSDGGFCPYDRTALLPDDSSTKHDTPPPPKKPKIRVVSAKGRADSTPAPVPRRDRRSEYDRLINTTLDGRYRIESKLGEGGMGVVFMAKHTIIEKIVAIKVLKREVARDHNVVKRFVQEAKAASRIGHPNIVDVTDFGTTPDGMTYSVMEFVDGITLGRLLKSEAPLPLKRALPILAQMGKALGAAHEKGIVHRDLKPENIFLMNRAGRRDFVKIVDFGIAKVMPLEGDTNAPRLTRAGTVFGTPEYMAPEQAAGRNDTDQRVDIYALGTIFYEMVVAKVPHKGETTVRTLAMQMLDPIEPPRKARPDLAISDELEGVIMHALAKKREERYASMEEFLSDLERNSGGIPLKTAVAVGPSPMVAGADDRTLMPLPPGADKNIVASPGVAARKATPRHEQKTIPEEFPDDGSAKPKRRKAAKSDPVFLNQDAPIPLDLPFETYDGDITLGTRRPKSWAVLSIIVTLLVAGGAAAAYWAMRGDKKTGATAKQTPVGQGAGTLAAARDAGAYLDATYVASEAFGDAGGEADPNETGPGPGHPGRHPSEHLPRDPSNRRMLQVQVVTRPEGATLYAGTTYAGTGDTFLRRPEGTRLTVTCRLRGYQPGSIQVVFNGAEDVFLCKCKRKKRCIPGIKNPFDDCPE